MNNKPVVIMISAKAQHGKDTFADTFIENANNYRCLKIKYGDVLKFIAKEYFSWNGEKDEKGRQLLQWLGTDLCRENNENVWVNCVKEIVKALQTEYDFILIPDCRFPNELNWEDTDYLTYTVRIVRKNEDGTSYDNHLTEEQKKHPSETALDDYKFNYEIENRDMQDLNFAARTILSDIVQIGLNSRE